MIVMLFLSFVLTQSLRAQADTAKAMTAISDWQHKLYQVPKECWEFDSTKVKNYETHEMVKIESAAKPMHTLHCMQFSDEGKLKVQTSNYFCNDLNPKNMPEEKVWLNITTPWSYYPVYASMAFPQLVGFHKSSTSVYMYYMANFSCSVTVNFDLRKQKRDTMLETDQVEVICKGKPVPGFSSCLMY